jgi:S1-C subfamily serine protease
MEEHGLEVVSLDPNSPAAQAGLKSSTGMTAAGAAGSTASSMLGPLNLLVMPLLAKGGALGQGGDLIVAVDDRRVRSQGDLDDAMAHLKPGDTMYLTVIRPVGNAHKTMKIAVKVGAVGEPIANAAPPSTSASSGGESLTH